MQIRMNDEVVGAYNLVANYARGIAQMKNGDQPAVSVTLDAGFLRELRAAVASLDAAIAANLKE